MEVGQHSCAELVGTAILRIPFSAYPLQLPGLGQTYQCVNLFCKHKTVV